VSGSTYDYIVGRIAMSNMETDMEAESEPHETLDQLIKEIALSLAFKKFVANCTSADDVYRDTPVTAHATPPPQVDSLQPTWLKPWMRSVPKKVNDWKRLATEFFEVGTGAIGIGRMAFARSASTRADTHASEATQFQIWQQGALGLTLSCENKHPYTVTLRVDDPHAKVAQLYWVDEGSLTDDSDAPLQAQSFSVTQVDAQTYTVQMPVAIFADKIRAIVAAQQHTDAEGLNPRLLLPFVVLQ